MGLTEKEITEVKCKGDADANSQYRSWIEISVTANTILSSSTRAVQILRHTAELVWRTPVDVEAVEMRIFYKREKTVPLPQASFSQNSKKMAPSVETTTMNAQKFCNLPLFATEGNFIFPEIRSLYRELNSHYGPHPTT